MRYDQIFTFCLLFTILLAVASAPAQAKSTDTPASDTLRDMWSVNTSIDAYRFYNGALPGPTDGFADAEFLRPFVEPVYIRQLPAEDAWGRTFGYFSEGGSYMLVSYGQDGLPDHFYENIDASALQDGGDDIVVIDGAMVALPVALRQWVLCREQKITMGNMRSIAIAVESYKIDNGATPGPTPGMVNAAWLQELVAPIHIETLPLNDAWDEPFLYWSDGEHYRIVSLGLDRSQDRPFDEIERGTGTQTFTSDIVFDDGEFTQFPEGEQR